MTFRGLWLGLVLVATVAFATEEDADRKSSLERTGLPQLCAERLPESASTDRCVEHQLAAGRRIRKLLLANPSDDELGATIERCATQAVSPGGTYDWVGLEDCVRAWVRTARRSG